MKEHFISILEDLNRLYKGELINYSIKDYVEKIQRNATIITFQEEKIICGFIAFYNNDYRNKIAYLTMLAVNPLSQGKGIGKMLLKYSIDRLKYLEFKKYNLEVLKTNDKAIQLYTKNGFKILQETETHYKMTLVL